MATLKIFAVHDNKVSSYGSPFIAKNEIEACRSLQTAVNDEAIQLSHYPEDFDLFLIGEFDDITGNIENASPPKFIVGAISLVKHNYRQKLESDLKKKEKFEYDDIDTLFEGASAEAQKKAEEILKKGKKDEAK